MKLTISPVATTYIKSYNHDKYSPLEPSQGFKPLRGLEKKAIRKRSTLIREVQQDFMEFESPVRGEISVAKSLKLTISPVATTYIKSYNHDKYSPLEPSQGFKPLRGLEKTRKTNSKSIYTNPITTKNEIQRS